MGASFLAIPCNTAHHFYDDIARSVRIPVLHIVEEVVAYLKGRVSHAGILATTATVQIRLYQIYLKNAGIYSVLPGHEDQIQVMRSIYLVKEGNFEEARQCIPGIVNGLKEKGCQAVIAGCTEIPLVIGSHDYGVEIVDPTELLAKACIRTAKEGSTQ